MSELSIIRDYENTKLPLEQRIPSLGRRFPSLAKAAGLDLWNPTELWSWLEQTDDCENAWHAGLLLLSLWDDGPWPAFEAAKAVRDWDDSHRVVFAAWARTWKEVSIPS